MYYVTRVCVFLYNLFLMSLKQPWKNENMGSMIPHMTDSRVKTSQSKMLQIDLFDVFHLSYGILFLPITISPPFHTHILASFNSYILVPILWCKYYVNQNYLFAIRFGNKPSMQFAVKKILTIRHFPYIFDSMQNVYPSLITVAFMYIQCIHIGALFWCRMGMGCIQFTWS